MNNTKEMWGTEYTQKMLGYFFTQHWVKKGMNPVIGFNQFLCSYIINVSI